MNISVFCKCSITLHILFSALIKDYFCAGMTMDYYVSAEFEKYFVWYFWIFPFFYRNSEQLKNIPWNIENIFFEFCTMVNNIKLDGRYASQLKTFKLSLGAIMEDFVQVCMQYFYFEAQFLKNIPYFSWFF